MPPWPGQEGVYTAPGPRMGLARGSVVDMYRPRRMHLSIQKLEIQACATAQLVCILERRRAVGVRNPVDTTGRGTTPVGRPRRVPRLRA